MLCFDLYLLNPLIKIDIFAEQMNRGFIFI